MTELPFPCLRYQVQKRMQLDLHSPIRLHGVHKDSFASTSPVLRLMASSISRQQATTWATVPSPQPNVRSTWILSTSMFLKWSLPYSSDYISLIRAICPAQGLTNPIRASEEQKLLRSSLRNALRSLTLSPQLPRNTTKIPILNDTATTSEWGSTWRCVLSGGSGNTGNALF